MRYVRIYYPVHHYTQQWTFRTQWLMGTAILYVLVKSN